LANAYYAAQMKTASPGSDQRKWGDAISVIRPTFAKSGATFVNISGAGVARYSPNRDNAIKLMEFLASEDGQALYASADFEYPVRKNVQADPMLTSFGPLVIDSLSLNQIAAQRKKASALVDRVRFDQ
jgi:iron(III) transport system substrate-binding protein